MKTICIQLSDLSQEKQNEIIEAIKEVDNNQEPEGSYEFWVWLEIDNNELRIMN